MNTEKIKEIIDSGEPFLFVKASDPRAFAIASIVKNIYVIAQLYEQAANAREAEKAIFDWVRQKNVDAEFKNLNTELGKVENELLKVEKKIKRQRNKP